MYACRGDVTKSTSRQAHRHQLSSMHNTNCVRCTAVAWSCEACKRFKLCSLGTMRMLSYSVIVYGESPAQYKAMTQHILRVLRVDQTTHNGLTLCSHSAFDRVLAWYDRCSRLMPLYKCPTCPVQSSLRKAVFSSMPYTPSRGA